jgi:hypothetical protein
MTKINCVETAPALPMDESTIIDYLKKNPNVLERHPEVVTQLTFSHDTGAAVSLVERQLRLLRDENQGLKNKLSSLVHIARENEELGQRFHRLSLELMAGEHLHDIIAMTQDQVQTFFYTDYVSFCFNDEFEKQLNGLEKNVLDSKSRHRSEIREWMEQRKPVFGPFDPGLQKQFFGDQRQIASCVLIPLYHTRDFGLLVLGSKSRDRFTNGMGTVFLRQLGELISGKIKNYLT